MCRGRFSITFKCIESDLEGVVGVAVKDVRETTHARTQIESQRAAALKTLRLLLVGHLLSFFHSLCVVVLYAFTREIRGGRPGKGEVQL